MNPSIGNHKRVLLTGASGRLGAAFIELFASRFEIVALTHTNSAMATTQNGSMYDPIAGSHNKSRVKEVKCDLSDGASITAAVDTVTDLVGPINYLINAAADVRFLGATIDVTQFHEQAERQWRINTLAPMLLASCLFHRAWKHVEIGKQDAAILNVSSISGSSAFQGSRQATYAASKAALNMLTMYMAAEYRQYNIRVNGLAPNTFPARIPTRAVAEAACKIVEGMESGRIYNGGYERTSTSEARSKGQPASEIPRGSTQPPGIFPPTAMRESEKVADMRRSPHRSRASQSESFVFVTKKVGALIGGSRVKGLGLSFYLHCRVCLRCFCIACSQRGNPRST